MSKGKGGSNVAATVNEGEGERGVAVPPTVNEDKAGVAMSPMVIEGEDKVVTPPIINKSQGTDDIHPVMSYESGNDYLEPVISDGEVKYEGKGKGRTESFSHLPAPRQSVSNTAPKARPTSQAQADSAPSTTPSTRPASQVQNDSAPSTAPTTRPSSQVQADPESSTTGGTSSVEKEKGDSAVITAQDDSGPITGQDQSAATATQGNSAPATGQGDSAATTAQDASPHHTTQSGSGPIAAQDNTTTKNCVVRHDCGCTDIYDDTGKKRQQACDHHKFNPNKSILPLPPKKPLSESTNLQECTRDLLVHTPQASRNEESPPRQPPVVIPTKGRKFVQGSENGPAFLDPFNFERAIEPTRPPNTLTTIPTQKDVPLKKKSTGRESNPKVSAPNASGPKAPNPETTQNIPNPPQVHEDASGTQANRPQKSDAMEGHEQEPSASEDEQPTDEKAATEPQQGDGKAVENDGGSPLDDEHQQIFTGRERKQPLAPLCSPAHRKDIAPKPILKKPVETPAETTVAEGEDAPSGLFSTDYGSEISDRSGGVKLFQETLAKLKGGESSRRAAHTAGGPVREDQGGVPIPRLVLNTDAGPVGASTNSNGEPVFDATAGSRDSDGESSDGNGNKFLSKCCSS